MTKEANFTANLNMGFSDVMYEYNAPVSPAELTVLRNVYSLLCRNVLIFNLAGQVLPLVELQRKLVSAVSPESTRHVPRALDSSARVIQRQEPGEIKCARFPTGLADNETQWGTGMHDERDTQLRGI